VLTQVDQQAHDEERMLTNSYTKGHQRMNDEERNNEFDRRIKPQALEGMRTKYPRLWMFPLVVLLAFVLVYIVKHHDALGHWFQ